MIIKNTLFVDLNYLIKSFDTASLEPINQNSIEVPKVKWKKRIPLPKFIFQKSTGFCARKAL